MKSAAEKHDEELKNLEKQIKEGKDENAQKKKEDIEDDDDSLFVRGKP